ncbi:putative 7-deoxyloganetin glucosyltransferase [Helianthus anomalus]
MNDWEPSTTMATPHVVVIPYPTQGHVIPILELAQRLVQQGFRVTFVNTDFNHKCVTNNWLDKDNFRDLMQMVSISDGLEPWDDWSDIYKLTLSIMQTMPHNLEPLNYLCGGDMGCLHGGGWRRPVDARVERRWWGDIMKKIRWG